MSLQNQIRNQNSFHSMTYLILLLYFVTPSHTQYHRNYLRDQDQHQQSRQKAATLPPKNQTKEDEIKSALCVVKGPRQPTPIALNAVNFTDLIKHGNVFIDRTMMIKDLFDYGPPVKIIARPNGWGKSVNLNMVRFFYEIQVDEETGKAVGYRELTPSYDLFYHGLLTMADGNVKQILTPLLISKHHDFMEEHQGQHPVIYLNFTDFQPISYATFRQAFHARLRDAFAGHEYMVKVLQTIMEDPGADDEMNDFAGTHLTIFDRVMNLTDAEDEVLQQSLKSLCYLLHRHFGQKPLILVEEYDTPFVSVQMASDRTKKQRLLDFYKTFINETFEENTDLEKALLIGDLRIMEESMVSFMYDTNEDIFFDEYHGFDAKQVEWIFQHLEIPERLRVQAIAHYGGYNVDLNDKLNFSGCSSIARFVASKQLEEYFVASHLLDTSTDRFFVNVEFLQTLDSFVSGCSTVVRLNWDAIHFELNDLTHTLVLRKYDEISYKINTKEYHIINSALYVAIKLYCAMGYLTLSTRESDEVTVKIPNEEIRNVLRNKLLIKYSQQFGLVYQPNTSTSRANKFGESFESFLMNRDEDTTGLQNIFDTFFNDHLPSIKNHRRVPTEDRRRAIFIRSLLNFVILHIRGFRLIHSETFFMDNNTQLVTDVALIHKNGDHGVVVAFGWGDRPLNYIQLLTASRMDLFYTENKKVIKTAKHVVAQLTPQSSFQIIAKWSEYQNVRVFKN